MAKFTGGLDWLRGRLAISGCPLIDYCSVTKGKLRISERRHCHKNRFRFSSLDDAHLKNLILPSASPLVKIFDLRLQSLPD